MNKTEDIGNIVVGNNNGVPVRIRDIGEVTIGNAPRLGEFGFQKNDDRVEGVILMLTRRADAKRPRRAWRRKRKS